MKPIHPLFIIQLALNVILSLLIATSVSADTASQASSSRLASLAANRIVSVGGAVTEIIYALGEEHRLVARDTTSNFPAEALKLPDVGYIRRLSPEGVLSVNPDLIISQEGAGPPEAVELLRSASIPMIEIPEGYTSEAVIAKINGVAAALGVPEKGAFLAERIQNELDQATAGTKGTPAKRVLFILSLQGGRIMAAGNNTSAQGIIELAGGVNAINGYEGYKPVTDEAITLSNADTILLMVRAGADAITNEALFSHPAISTTPAAQNKSVVRMDGMLLLGFSTRTGQAVTDLSHALRNEN